MLFNEAKLANSKKCGLFVARFHWNSYCISARREVPTHMDLTVMEMARVANQILNEVKEMVKEMKVVAVMIPIQMCALNLHHQTWIAVIFQKRTLKS